MTTTNKTLNFASIITVDTEGVASLNKSEKTTLNFGGMLIDRWNNNSGFRVIHTGEDCKGKESIELQGYEAVAGFYNAMMLLHDNHESFEILKVGVHVYAAAAKRSYTQSAGYVANIIEDKTLGGLPVKVWRAVRREGGSYAGAGLIKAVPYSQTRTWGEKARKENEHMHHIINLHNGIDAVLQIAKGTHFVTFKTFDWSDGSKAELANKEKALTMGKEYRAEKKADGKLRKELAQVMEVARNAASTGKFVADSAAPASYVNLMNVETPCQLSELIGKTFEACKADGSTLLAYRFGVNTAEEAATRLASVRSFGGFLREVE